MSSFIKNYLEYLRKSDKQTKDKSALFLAFITTLIILSIIFLIFKDSIFSINSQNTQTEENKNTVAQNLEDSSNTKNYVVSPFTSFAKFLKDTGEQFSKIKTDISSTVGSSTNKN